MKKVDRKDRRKGEMMKTTWAKVQDLENTRRRLQCEIRQKEAVLNIDESCRKITPTVASVRRRRPMSAAAIYRTSSAPTLPDVTMTQSQARRQLQQLDAESPPTNQRASLALSHEKGTVVPESHWSAEVVQRLRSAAQEDSPLVSPASTAGSGGAANGTVHSGAATATRPVSASRLRSPAGA